jgi:hypothetical protein
MNLMRNTIALLASATLLLATASAFAQTSTPKQDKQGITKSPPAAEAPVGPTTGRGSDPDRALDPQRPAAGDNPPGSRVQDRDQREETGATPEGRR